MLAVAVNPFLSMMHPNISQDPKVAAALGLSGQHAAGHVNASDATLAGLRYHAVMMARELHSLSGGSGGVPHAAAGALPQLPPAAGGSSMAVADGGEVQRPSASGDRAFPKLSAFCSFQQLWEWYTKPMPGHTMSPKEYEGKNDTSWRAGSNNRKRWSDMQKLVDLVERRAVDAGQQRGRVVGQADAAAMLDAEVQQELAANGVKGGYTLATYFRELLLPCPLTRHHHQQ